jgi:hypothetical protein
LVGAFIWPIVLLILFRIYRKQLPGLVKGLTGRLSKVEFAGISIELAKAKAFVPEWVGPSGALDLRHKATSFQVYDSTARTFLTQLTEKGTGDYAEVNLGAGDKWLTSRLFIMAIVFARMKGIKYFVFLESSPSVRKRYIGWADAEKVRWTLAKRFPWLEYAYSDAYATVSQTQPLIVSNDGRLGLPNAPDAPDAGIELLKEFLIRIQTTFAPPSAPPVPEEWTILDAVTNTHERSSWIDAEELERLLGVELHTAIVYSSELRSKDVGEQLKLFLAETGQFVAVVGADERFEYLVRRNLLLEQIADTVVSEPAERSDAS